MKNGRKEAERQETMARAQETKEKPRAKTKGKGNNVGACNQPMCNSTKAMLVQSMELLKFEAAEAKMSVHGMKKTAA